MCVNINAILQQLTAMSVGELRAYYAEVHGEAARSRHRDHLIHRIVWRLQANEEGGLPERARRRAMEIASDADLRIRAPRPTPGSPVGARVDVDIGVPRDDRLPLPGTVLVRHYRGREIQVRVLATGFEYMGTLHPSLTAVARAITGAHWNGFRFFNLDRAEKEASR